MNSRNQREIQAHEFLKNWIKQQLVGYLKIESIPSGIVQPLSDALIEIGVEIRNNFRHPEQ